jgi:hypothetical protein
MALDDLSSASAGLDAFACFPMGLLAWSLSVKLEPPGADPVAGWCRRSGRRNPATSTRFGLVVQGACFSGAT